jgi:hypothetical protein
VFITWKKYGFRHIVREATIGEVQYWDGTRLEIRGVSLCGNRFAEPFEGGMGKNDKRTSFWYGHDLHAEERPLCGHCAKHPDRNVEIQEKEPPPEPLEPEPAIELMPSSVIEAMERIRNEKKE